MIEKTGSAVSGFREGQRVIAEASGNAAFAKLLAESAGIAESGLGLFGKLRTQEGRIDLKKAGLFSIVSAARVLAIRHGIAERGTRARFERVQALSLGHDADLESLASAQALFLDLLVDQQVVDIAQGIAPSNKVFIRRMSGTAREQLRIALGAVRHVEPSSPKIICKPHSAVHPA